MQALCVIACSGCSFVLIRPSPHISKSQSETTYNCSTYAIPGLEIAAVPIGGLVAFGTVVTASCDGSEDPQTCESDAHTRTKLILAASAVVLVSSIYGFVAEASCRGKAHRLATELRSAQ